jgi:hypothetical protein
MGFDSQIEYDYAARDLTCMCDGARTGVLVKRDGTTMRFVDPATGEFGVTSPQGIVTHF